MRSREMTGQSGQHTAEQRKSWQNKKQTQNNTMDKDLKIKEIEDLLNQSSPSQEKMRRPALERARYLEGMKNRKNLANKKIDNRINNTILPTKTSTKNKIAVALSIVIILMLVGIMMLTTFNQFTGYSILDNAEVFSGKRFYHPGDMAHIFIIPSNVYFSLEVYHGSEIITKEANFVLDNLGNYTIKAILTAHNETKTLFYNFSVVPVEMNLSALEQSYKDNYKEAPAANISTPTNKTEPISAAGVNPNKKSQRVRPGKIPDVEFSKSDMKIMTKEYKGKQKKVVELAKEGVNITIIGANPERINNVRYKKGIVHVDSAQIDKATITIPRKIISPVSAAPKLYVKNDYDAEFHEAVAYEKDNETFNRVDVHSDTYKFNVEHFTSYYVDDPVAWQQGMVNNSLDFRGDNDYIVVPDRDIWDFNGNFTIEFWVKTKEIAEFQSLVDHPGAWQANIDASSPQFRHLNTTSGASQVTCTADKDFVADSWAHVAYAYDNSSLKIYFNGTLNKTCDVSGGTKVATPDLYIGSYQTSYYLNGSLDEVRIYNKTFNATEVLTSFNRAKDGNTTNNSRSGLIGEWNLNETQGFVAYDSSDNNNNGTLTNFGNNYETLQDCLDNANNTATCCVITEEDYYEKIEENTYKIGDSSCGVRFSAENITIDFNNSRLSPFSSGSNYGIYSYREADNVSAYNAILQDYDNTVLFDGNGGYGNHTLINITGIKGIISLKYLSGKITIQNMWLNDTGSSSNSFYILQGTAAFDVDNLYLTNSSITARHILLDSIDNSEFNNVHIDAGSSGDDCVEMVNGMTSNNFTDWYMSCNGGRGFDLSNADNNIFKNIVINNTLIGADVLSTSTGNDFINITVFNSSQEGFKIAGNQNQIINCTLNESGTSTRTQDFYIDNSPRTYTGLDYDYNSGMYILKNDGVYLYPITADNTNASNSFDGTNNATLCLYNVTLAGARITAIANQSGLCELGRAVLEASFGTTSTDYEEADVFGSNGAGEDYSVSFSESTTTVSGYSEPRLEYTTYNYQTYAPIFVSADNINITGTTFHNDSSGIGVLYAINIGGTNTSVWLNNFLYAGVNDSGTTTDFCVDDDGNFYEESLSTAEIGNGTGQSKGLWGGDCGPANVTYPNSGLFNNTATITGNWTAQSSQSSVTYDVYANKSSDGARTYIGSTSDVYISIDSSSLADSIYKLLIIPYISGSRFNATNILGSDFTINSSAISACRELNESDKVYYLTQNVASDRTCFNLSAENVTLDCKGYTIKYGSSDTVWGPAVRIYNNYTTVKDCIIIRNETGADYGYGIFMRGANNSTIVNNTIVTIDSGDSGIAITRTYNSTIANNTITTGGAYSQGIYFVLYASYNYIERNVITTNRTLSEGIELWQVEYNTFKSNNITARASGAFGIDMYLTGSYATDDYTTYCNQSIDTSNLAYGKPVNFTFKKSGIDISNVNYTKYGQVFFCNCSDINVSNSSFTDGGIHAVYSRNIGIFNSNVTMSYGDAIMFRYVQYGNITNNTINISSTDGGNIGISIYKGSNHTGITNNSIYTSTKIVGYGIHPSYSQFLSIDNNRVITKGPSAPALFPEGLKIGNIIRGGNYTTHDSGYASAAFYTQANPNVTVYDAIFYAVNQDDIKLHNS
ncbi:LamG-like jellyroll fold domain-containing protein, partial [Thermoproteota archaeon]